jgi:NADH-quinone oxidoreductase subunit A
MPDNHFAAYLPLLMHFAIAFGLAVAIVVLSYLVGQHKPNRVKVSPYECGVQPIGDARGRFSVKFDDLKMFGFWEMIVYIAVILVGLFYVWKKGVLDWGLHPKRGDV